jgi:PIN domain nuclease of toxin-antitoxin system
VREAPLTFEVVYAMARIDLPHRDPADRFLAATAYAYGLTLVTADRNLSSLKNIEVLVNR